MYPFQRIFNALRRWLRPKRSFQLDVDTLESLRVIAEREQTTPQEVAGYLLEDALRRDQQLSVSLALWQMLTPREQEVTALICLNYTSRQIGVRLHISPETVKTHVAHILVKFNLSSRNELRQLMSGLDFSQWAG
jgi:DNA-binding CsgD family transcriptional regulator